MADLLIQGGEVLDPGQGLRGRLDIAVSQGQITQRDDIDLEGTIKCVEQN